MVRANLLGDFDREIEVLELCDDSMIYALDQKDEIRDKCVLERMDLKTHRIERLIDLDYTRLYESFRTYGQLKNFFYAVNVLQDYRVRLRRIDKCTWENTADFYIVPEGEIINIYPLNEDYMIITDEVKAEPAVLAAFGITAHDRRYVNVRYLYEISTACKYPIKDLAFDSLTEEMPVCYLGGIPTLVHEVFYRDESQECADGMSAIVAVSVDSFIAHVKADGLCGFKPLVCAGEDGFTYVRRMAAVDHTIVFRRRNKETGQEQIAAFQFEKGDRPKLLVIADYKVPGAGEVFYDLWPAAKTQAWNVRAFYCGDDEDAPVKTMKCLTEPDFSIDFAGEYGTFAKAFGKECFVTTYHAEVFVKEYEYHEYVACHDLKDGHVETFEGRFEAAENTLVLLPTFLAL